MKGMIRNTLLCLVLVGASCGDGDGWTNLAEPIIAAPVAPVTCISVRAPCHLDEQGNQICAEEIVEIKGKFVVTDIPPGSQLADLQKFVGYGQVCTVNADCGWAVGSSSVRCTIEAFTLEFPD